MATNAESTTSGDVFLQDLDIQDKVVLILCGLVASGKSTFAEALQHHFPQICRCNQDDLGGDRRRVEQLARSMLNEGHSVCIDRTNFNASQRSYWIEIAREFPGTMIWVIVFDTPYETCAARLQTREDHPTIKNAREGLSILSRFAADFRHPSPLEGFHRILYVKPEDHVSPVYSRSDIAAILHRVRDSAPMGVSHTHAAHRGAGFNLPRGGSTRGNRGQRGGYSQGSHYPHYPPRGRRSHFNPTPPNDAQQNMSYRGNAVGAYRVGRGQSPQYPPNVLTNRVALSEIGTSSLGNEDASEID